MSDAAYARLTRYAVFSVVHGVIAIVALSRVAEPWAVYALALASLPLFFAWGSFQADVALNPLLDEPGRTRWRVFLWMLPWSMALYWLRHVRPRRRAASL